MSSESHEPRATFHSCGGMIGEDVAVWKCQACEGHFAMKNEFSPMACPYCRYTFTVAKCGDAFIDAGDPLGQ